MAGTSIEWTERTWNPLRGCSRISEGCRNCYAERMAARFSKQGEPFCNVIEDGQWNRCVELVESKLYEPLSWQKPCRVFVNSMSDLFHEAVPDEWIDAIFGVMALRTKHVFQVLTKRASGMQKYFVTAGRCRKVWHIFERRWPLPNVWLGVSVEDQKSADERIPHLLATPAAVRFVSVEPLLGPVDLRCIQHEREFEVDALTGDHGVYRPLRGRSDRKLDWVIVGGESGPGARPCQLEWIRSIVRQCAEARVPCFVKQLGTAWVRDGWYMSHTTGETWAGKKGNDPSRWPPDLNVRQYPEPTEILFVEQGDSNV